MYIPASFRESSDEKITAFIDAYPFATLVSSDGQSPFATHLPLVLDRARKVLVGHVARANPQWQQMQSDRELLAIFHGPHAYISPLMYEASPAVPTWNYAVVHVYGVPRILEDFNETATAVEQLVSRFDADPSRWRKAEDAPFLEKLLAAIVAFEIPLSRIEAKFKLGQNRSAADQTKMLAALAAGDQESQNLARFMEQQR